MVTSGAQATRSSGYSDSWGCSGTFGQNALHSMIPWTSAAQLCIIRHASSLTADVGRCRVLCKLVAAKLACCSGQAGKCKPACLLSNAVDAAATAFQCTCKRSSDILRRRDYAGKVQVFEKVLLGLAQKAPASTTSSTTDGFANHGGANAWLTACLVSLPLMSGDAIHHT